ncbi:hypothetical protein [Paenibacillus massiliensis]|uniref:hypothetical protein n=1 Tax=Paenibacillus massiliensis TaxID=225917 RepID=UPI000491565B|nr:hypothetical protein [Paenibacillus massiliensis]
MTYAFRIEPEHYISFTNEDELLEQCRAWGLVSDKATKLKTFYYKGNGLNITCELVGYTDHVTAVIQFDNGEKHTIHPSYLKEMQAASFGVKNTALKGEQAMETDPVSKASVQDKSAGDDVESESGLTIDDQPADAEGDYSDELSVEQDQDAGQAADSHEYTGFKGDPDGLVEEYIAPESKAASTAPAQPKAKGGKAKAPKLELPEGKVKMSAIVKEFTTVPNHFSDNDDEVIIYEQVSILEPELLEVGEAWSSHSATMKKHELAEGDVLTFEAKIIKKKLAKYPVPYKINNPSKIAKSE